MESESNVVKVLGEGAFGKVSLVKRDGDKFFARKEMGDNLDMLVGIKEMNIVRMASALSPHVVKIDSHKIDIKDNGEYTIDQDLEYCRGGCLDDILDEEDSHPDREMKPGDVARRISEVTDLAEGLATLHKNGIYHMDLKLDNILYRDPGMCLCDFSNSIIRNDWKKSFHPPQCQYHSLVYRSPDIAMMRTAWENTEKSDVWGFGIILLECFGMKRLLQDFEVYADGAVARFKTVVSRFKSRDTRDKFEDSSIFGNIFPDSMNGWDLTRDSSNEFAALWCSIMARQIKNLDYEKVYRDSLKYFHVRKCQMTESEKKDLHNLITNIIPKMLQVEPRSRPSMREVCELLGRDVPNASLEKYHERNNDLGRLWDEVVEDVRSDLTEVTVIQGSEHIPIPEQIFIYAKALCEASMVNIQPPKKQVERSTFFRNMLASSLILGCELFDVMIEVDNNNHVIPNKVNLNDLGPYIADIANQMSGKLFDIIPTEEELKVL